MAAARFYSSNATTTTLTGGIGSGVTSIVVGSVTGFPSSFPYTLILDPDGLEEVVTVSAGAGTTLTVARGADGTSAIAHDAGVTVRHGVSARDFREPQEHIGASTDVHGLTGGSSVAGTTQAQTLTNKTISGSANTLSNIPQASVTGLVADLTTANVTHPADTSTHGVAVSIVGTTEVQTLTNKTLTSPTLTTPTIASFVNAAHTHANAAGGGTLSASAYAEASSNRTWSTVGLTAQTCTDANPTKTLATTVVSGLANATRLLLVTFTCDGYTSSSAGVATRGVVYVSIDTGAIVGSSQAANGFQGRHVITTTNPDQGGTMSGLFLTTGTAFTISAAMDKTSGTANLTNEAAGGISVVQLI